VAIGLESRQRHKLGKGCPAAAAEARTPASWWLGLNNKQAGMLRWCRRKAGVARIGVASSWSTEFTTAAPMADGGACLRSCEEKGGSFIAGSRQLGVPCARRPRGQGMGGGTAKYGEVWAAACNGLQDNGGKAVRRPAIERGTRGAGPLP
jgi:hypothetical protein